MSCLFAVGFVCNSTDIISQVSSEDPYQEKVAQRSDAVAKWYQDWSAESLGSILAI